jgi:hypothetical protein
MNSAKSESHIQNKTKSNINDKATSDKKNHDIRFFFKNSTGPSTITTNKRIIQVIQPYINDINENSYKFRERKIKNYKTKFELSGSSDEEEDNKSKDDILSEIPSSKESNEDLSNESFDEGNGSVSKNLKKKNRKAKSLKKPKNSHKKQKREIDNGNFQEYLTDKSDESEESSIDNSEIDYIELGGAKSFQKFRSEAANTIHEAEQELKRLVKEFYINEHKIGETKSKYPDKCIPVRADIREFKFKNLAEKQMELTGQLFDIIMMDPPWQLSSSQPTRGVAIAYDTLHDNIITDIPIPKLQTDGFIFIWTINAKFKVTLDLIKSWGYRYLNLF